MMREQTMNKTFKLTGGPQHLRGQTVFFANEIPAVVVFNIDTDGGCAVYRYHNREVFLFDAIGKQMNSAVELREVENVEA